MTVNNFSITIATVNCSGSQYRSAIFYQNDTQKKIAEQVIRVVDASGKWKRPQSTRRGV